MAENTGLVKESSGTIAFSNDVVANIAGLAAKDVPGLAGMSGGIVGGIAELLGANNYAKGINITLDGDKVTIRAAIIVKNGEKLIQVAESLQSAVKSAVETMTGLTVQAVDVDIQGIDMK